MRQCKPCSYVVSHCLNSVTMLYLAIIEKPLLVTGNVIKQWLFLYETKGAFSVIRFVCDLLAMAVGFVDQMLLGFDKLLNQILEP